MVRAVRACCRGDLGRQEGVTRVLDAWSETEEGGMGLRGRINGRWTSHKDFSVQKGGRHATYDYTIMRHMF